MKKVLFLFVSLLTFSSYAQKAVRIYYTKEEIATDQVKEAEFYLDVVEQGDTLYRYSEYDVSDQRRADGEASKLFPYLMRHGRYVAYFPDQTKRQTGSYEQNQKVSIWRTFYANGNTEEVGAWVKRKEKKTQQISYHYALLTFADSSGQLLVNQGNGKMMSYHANGQLKESGKYQNGLKDSVWVGFHENGKKYFEETYRAGVLQQGQSTDEADNTFSYTVPESLVSFKQDNVYRFMAMGIRYPVEAQRRRIQGVVMTSFVIDSEGTARDIRVHSSPDNSLTQETLRLIKASEKLWKPATVKGKIVEKRFKFPLSFVLQ